MKYFETKHERNSAKITTLIAVLIILLLFVVGTQYMDPPEEYGVAVNFGTTDFGSGDVQPTKPIKSEPREVEKQPQETVKQPEQKQAEAASAKTKAEDVLTENNDEAIAIKKQKEAEAKAKKVADAKAKAQAEADAKAKAEADKLAKEQAEKEAKKKKLDALIGGVSKSEGQETGGEGDDNKAGDKGQLDGDPYAASYFGEPGSGNGGVGYGLKGRGAPTKKVFKQDCNESGMVIVKIVVNRNGDVIEATPGVKGTTNTASCLLEPAKKIALSHKWRADSKAPTKQVGFVKVNFNLGQ
ncbi:cell envelope integrity protein TolA [Xanthomarina sp. GH4-25]|uniref:cell envelope integrity protein TolA n=1 Tax=Xanthomarina sp. GH4-25 TaxID=3349335 RepID=UPI000D67D800|nr:cell envelope integrity protein TolA [Flavobacteriaceae bacterium LYZ1037]